MLKTIGMILIWIVTIVVVSLIWLAVWYGMKFEIGVPDDAFYLNFCTHPLKSIY